MREELPPLFPRISPFGDRALLLEFSAEINPQTLGVLQGILRRLTAAQIPGLKELIPSYCSLLMGFDPFLWSFPGLSAKVREILADEEPSPGPPSAVKKVPVVYGGGWGPDLPQVAQYHQIAPAEVVRLHTSTEYRVFAIGGFPGLPAMGIVPKEIETPRLAVPRTKVLPGSVALAGKQTGIYAVESPGGWQLIGRTPLRFFDPSRRPPSWFQTGDRVRFFPIPESEFATFQPPFSLLTGLEGFSIFPPAGGMKASRGNPALREVCAGNRRPPKFPTVLSNLTARCLFPPGNDSRVPGKTLPAVSLEGRPTMKRQPLTLTLPLGSICRHKYPDTRPYRKSFPICNAFPDGIPEGVRKNRIDYRRALPGDNDIHFGLAADTGPLKQLLFSFDEFFRKRTLRTRAAK